MVDRPSQRRPLRRPLREVFGDELRRERHEQGRTLADVADDAAVSLPYLSEVERGVKDPSSEVIGAIADALELPVPELLERVARELRVATQRDVRAQLLAA
ncbi:MAG: helix-turn-helix domain-containing protein [Ilumatobacteraceae bacterium]|nr:helix-turn-helix domain-containing protein [Ilumatobacteraceae bacterium]